MHVINYKYHLSDTKLGSGAYSQVYLGHNVLDDDPVAIKCIDLNDKKNKEKSTLERIQTEIDLMQTFDHPNIVKYHDMVKTNDFWYIIMEYCDTGTLEQMIKYNVNMSKKTGFNREYHTFYYLNQLKDALNYLRSKGCAHRDIKPMNILLTRKNKSLEVNELYDDKENIVMKLADFGLSRSHSDASDNLMDTICGSPLYMAPELIFNKKYDTKADLWSFGIVMYQLLFGIHPHSSDTFDQLLRSLKNKKINFFMNRNFTEHCFDLLKKLLINDPCKRIEWNDLFQHQWFAFWENHGDTVYLRNPTNQIQKSKPINIKLKDRSESAPSIIHHYSSPVLIKSPLGPSNLSRMKIDQSFLKKYHYPFSYPPDEKPKLITEYSSSYSNMSTSNSRIFGNISTALDSPKHRSDIFQITDLSDNETTEI